MRLLYFLLLLFNLSAYTSAYGAYKTFDALPDVPHDWEQLSTAVDPSTATDLQIYIAKQNLDQLEDAVLKMSTPGDPTYGKHMTQEEIDSMIQPSAANFTIVETWLRSQVQGLNANALVRDEESITFNTTIGQAESLLQTKYSVFQFNGTKLSVIRTLNYSLPVGLHSAIEIIEGTIDFPVVPQAKRRKTQLKKEKPTSVRKRDDSFCALATPSCKSTIYGYPNYTAPDAPNNRIGVLGWLRDNAQYNDLHLFLEKYAPDMADHLFTCVAIPGGGDCKQVIDSGCDDMKDGCLNGESNMDVAATVTGAYPYETWFFDLSGMSYLRSFKKLLKRKDKNLPQVISTSYGEWEYKYTLKRSTALCNKIMQFGARGRSFLVASGDYSVGGHCKKAAANGEPFQFKPDILAACPYATVVGGTVWDSTNQVETTWDDSGSGFSIFHPRPKYQKKDVRDYLQGPGATDAANNAAYFHRSGRAFPDVAALAYTGVYFDNGEEVTDEGGTSLSAPIFGSVITLLNGIRLSEGKKPLGFLNPWLYKTVAPGGGFNDITTGRTIVTGFLGSGKTTLILNLLPQLPPPPNYTLAILKNEFGDVAVDSLLTSTTNPNASSVSSVTELLNGCICCNLVGQLSDAIAEIIRDVKPSRIIVETSGSAFPATLAMEINRISREMDAAALQDPSVPRITLDGVISVIDVENWKGYEDTSYTAKLQAKYTDLIVMNKWELCDERRLDDCVDRVRDVSEETPWVKSDKGRLGADLIFGIDGARIAMLETVEDEKDHGSHDHHDEVEVLSVRLPKRGEGLDGQKFLELLKKVPRDEVYRIKGIVWFGSSPEGKSGDGAGRYIFNWAFGRWTFTPYPQTAVEGEELALKMTIVLARGESNRWTKKVQTGGFIEYFGDGGAQDALVVKRVS
ncbi:Aorsin [Arthrobotrys entomopaga]|nr:Aorsin [Arthrobotrys entomopaga]